MAVLIVLIGVAASIFIAVDKYNSAISKHQSAQCIAQFVRSGHVFKKKYEYSSAIDYSDGGCPGYYRFDYTMPAEVVAIANTPEPSFSTSDGASSLGIGLIVTGVLAVIAYLSFWLLGWLCAGFTRDA